MFVKLVCGCFGLLFGLLFGYLVFSVFGGFGSICLITQLPCSCTCLVVLRCSVLFLLVVLVAIAVLLCLHC